MDRFIAFDSLDEAWSQWNLKSSMDRFIVHLESGGTGYATEI